MLKSICIQLWNRRRSNTTLLVELVLVFCLVWYMTDYLFVYLYNTRIPNYRNIEHTWRLNVTLFPENHPEYLPAENEPEALEAHYRRILQAVHNHPGVEAVAVCDQYSTPESGNYRGGGFYPEGDTSRMVSGQMISIYPQEDFFRTFRYSRQEGSEPVSVADFDWGDPQAIVISRSVAEELFPDREAVGKAILRQSYYEADSIGLRHVVAGVIDDTKRFAYNRPQRNFYLPMTLTHINDYRIAAISVRSNASTPDAIFLENFRREMSRSLRVGNFYLKNIVSYATLQEDITRAFGITGQIRTRLYLMIFFLLNILLCTMGTFWYRANQRRGEVGLRKALGATNESIFRSFLLEGLCLLAVGGAIAMLIELQFVRAGLIETMGQRPDMRHYLPDRMLPRFLITNFLSACLLSVVILISVWLPARKSAALSPSEALASNE